MSFINNQIDGSSMSMDEYRTEYKKSIKDPDIFGLKKQVLSLGLKNLLK